MTMRECDCCHQKFKISTLHPRYNYKYYLCDSCIYIWRDVFDRLYPKLSKHRIIGADKWVFVFDDWLKNKNEMKILRKYLIDLPEKVEFT